MDDFSTTAYECGHPALLVVSKGVVLGSPPLCQECAEEQVRKFAERTPDDLRHDLIPFVGPELAEASVQFVIGAMMDRAICESA